MGEVYEARDTRLNRSVAIKICKGKFTERFEREARAISSLNHPHICALYDIGREDSIEFLIMEYLEGETLEARLCKGPLPIDEALRIAIQIASALDAAHRKGVIHRDLKPGNVMLTRSGAKLLDFGLSKIAEPVLAGSNASMLTAAQPITREGTIVGTFQYMSPEQLEGKETDTLSDIFSFGAMLYEMITGRKSFDSSSQASLIAAVMSENPPPVSTIQPMASPALDRIVQRCLAKSPDDRWQSAGDLKSELEWIAEGGSRAGVPTPVAARRHNRERLAWILAGLAGAMLLAFFAAAYMRKKPAEAAEVRFQIPAPDKLSFFWYDMPAVSPDGKRIAFTAAPTMREDGRLFIRPLDADTAKEVSLPGTDAALPFWSPDGRQIAFFSKRTLQKVDVSGGSPVTICPLSSAASGGTWSRDGVILFSQAPGLLYRVNAVNGEVKPLWSLAEGETAQHFPQFLPDGNHYLYLSTSSRPGQQGVYAGSLDSKERKFIVATTAHAVYMEPGQLLFTKGDVLMAQPFDLRNLKLQGEPRPVADNIERMEPVSPYSGAVFAASSNGVLVWRRSSQSPNSDLQWVDRSGKKLSGVGDVADYSNPALSPDNRRLAIGIRDPRTKTRDIWIFDLLRGTRTRMTFDPADDLDSIWSPDGTRIAFSSNRMGQRDLYQVPADGSGSAELLLGGAGVQKNAEDWSPDGKYLAYNNQTLAPVQVSLYVLPLVNDRKPVPFVSTEFPAQQGQFSPNGRWIAYRSMESGRSEVYVQGFSLDSAQPRGKWQISTKGGEVPRWRRDGKELFYHYGNTFFAVDVKTDGASFEVGIPRPLFDAPTVRNYTLGGGVPFVVSSDGQRFLILAPAETEASSPFQVLVNWR
jgi:Tol biopolymer transport system component